MIRAGGLFAAALAGLLAFGGGAVAQDSGAEFDTSLDSLDDGVLTLEELQRLPEGSEQRELKDITTELQEHVALGQGAVIRALDKFSGEVQDIEIADGGVARFGRIDIVMSECRYPEGNPAGDAYAYLVIGNEGGDAPAFDGWMVASSPGLNALDHARYDVWVMRCITASGD